MYIMHYPMMVQLVIGFSFVLCTFGKQQSGYLYKQQRMNKLMQEVTDVLPYSNQLDDDTKAGTLLFQRRIRPHDSHHMNLYANLLHYRMLQYELLPSAGMLTKTKLFFMALLVL